MPDNFTPLHIHTSQLHELNAMLAVQMPALLSLCIIRAAVVTMGRWTLKTVLWKPLYSIVCAFAGALCWMRNAILCTLSAWMIWTLYSVLPEVSNDVCADVLHPRLQGLASGIALVTITTSNVYLSSALSLATLLAVRNTSSASLIIALGTAITTVSSSFKNHLRFEWTTTTAFFCGVVAHMQACGTEDGTTMVLLMYLLHAANKALATLWSVTLHTTRSHKYKKV